METLTVAIGVPAAVPVQGATVAVAANGENAKT